MRSQEAPFSLARMRGGLMWFAAGKAVSGVIGFVWLLTLVRVLAVADYGGYVVLLALLEIVHLVSNAGVYPFAQRYITEARLPSNVTALPRLVWGSLIYRLATLALATAGIALAAPNLSGWMGQPLLAAVLPLYCLVIVFEGGARYLELVFESLLQQGRAQFSAVLRYGSRLGCVLLWIAAGRANLTLGEVVRIEALTAAFGLLLAGAVAAHTLARLRKGHSPDGATAQPDFGWRRLAPFALPLYVAQCLTQLYSPDTLKLLVSRLLGVAEAAVFGFAHAMSSVLRRYLPATLLIGLIRPMLVARRADGGSDDELARAGNLVLKVNHFLLLPVAALFVVSGHEFAVLASGGKYPDAGALLIVLTLLLIPVGTHVVLSVLAIALEDRRAVLTGTLVSVPGVLVGLGLAPHLGSIGMAAGLWFSELMWCGFTLMMLRRRGFTFRIDVVAWVKLIVAASVAAALAAFVLFTLPLVGTQRLLVAIGVIAIAYPLTCWLLRPLTPSEQVLIRRMLPARLLIRRAPD